MGRIARALLCVLLLGPALLLLATCKNPLLDVVEYKVSRTGGDPNIEVSYKGIVVASGSSVDVGSAQSGGTPRTATFTIANTGPVPLTLSGNPLVVIGGTDASSFSPTTLPYKTIASGANTSFTLEFAPTTVAVKTASITITSDDPDTGTYSLTLSGRGVAAPGPDIQVSQGATILDNLPPPPPFGFGTVRAGSTSDVIFTITNVGTPGAILHLASSNTIVFSGADAARFSVVTPPGSLSISDGGTTTFTARFSPTAGLVKSYAATMRITSDDADESNYDVALTGSGQDSDLEVRQGVTVIPDGGTYGTSLGSVKADGPNEDVGTPFSFTIYNTGTWSLAITGVTLAGTNPSDFVLTNNTTSPVPAGGSTSFSVKFDPSSAAGAKSATVTIASDVAGSKNPYTFDVTGTATFAKKVYWVARDQYVLRRANLNGSNVEVVLTGLSDPTGLAIDQTNNKMYIGEYGHISSANLDGSGKTTLISAGSPYGIAVDSTYIFWADYASYCIGRALLNGTSPQTAGVANQPYGMAVEPSTDVIYWTIYGPPGVYKGSKSSLGSGGQIMGGGGVMGGVAFDEVNSKVYWANNGMNAIFRLDLGQIAGAPAPSGIAIDAADGWMFYTDYSGEVWRAGLDGTNATVIATSGGSRAYGIALDLVP